MTDRLVWIDCEMTGLDLARDALVEIACIVTDGQLNVADDGIDVIIKPPAEALDHMPDVVREMHTASGLLEELPAGVTLGEAQEAVLAYIRQHVPEARKVPLCGNSIGTDRAFLARDMPELDEFLHYRMVDVRASRNWPGAGTRGLTSPARPSTAATGRWPTSWRASGSCATTARPCSCPSPGPIPQPPGRSRRDTRASCPRPANRVPGTDPRPVCLQSPAAVSGRAAWWV
jgi:oligoribonuclease (3'-5' exoribonuclease)